jgi:diketogulonate reductase-like aldo/keto reductase
MINSIRDTITLAGGVEMPRFGLGVWQVDDENQLHGAVKAALDAGYWHIDTAQAYQNEDMVGRAVAKYADRDKLFITTKLTNNRQGDAEKAFEESLAKLQTDRVDLFLMHWPSPWRGTYVEAWKAMIKILESGRAKAIGVSNFKEEHLEKIIDATGVVPTVNQVERHPLFQQNELAAYCRAKGIVMEAYSPLGSGHLNEMAAALEPIVQKTGKTPAQIILRWHLQTDWVIIPKSVTPSRVAENAQIFDFQLDEEDMARVATLNCGRKFLPDANEAKF